MEDETKGGERGKERNTFSRINLCGHVMGFLRSSNKVGDPGKAGATVLVES